MSHQPVLLQESMTALHIKADGIYIDGTFGRGGHSEVILKHLTAKGRLIAFDKDPQAIEYARLRFGGDERFSIYHCSFAQMASVAQQEDIVGKINGVLLDLGVSSPQLDEAERGFSFLRDGPLDMRMDLSQALDAATFVNTASEKELIRVFKEYGEERFATRIARAIISARQQAELKTTQELAEIVKAANPSWEKHKHPATRVFQAIRIHVNHELEELETGLSAAVAVLAPAGRLAVISFHSLEDRLVKQFLQKVEKANEPPKGVPIRHAEIKQFFRRLGKAIKPGENEINNNIRSRSAVLRVGEKLE